MIITSEIPMETITKLLDKVPYLDEILSVDGVYLAGGLLRTILSTEDLNPQSTDVDIFFQNLETLEYIKKLMNQFGEYQKVFTCAQNQLHSYVYLDNDSPLNGWKIQLIAIDFYSDLESLVKSFDFTCTMFSTDGELLVMDENSLSDTESKILIWNVLTYPASSLRRMIKYAKKGYSMPEAELQKFISLVWNNDSEIRDRDLVYVD